MPKWSDFVSWVFFGLLAYYANSLTTSVQDMSDSIADLNVKMAVVVERDQTRGKDIDALKVRVDRLERHGD